MLRTKDCEIFFIVCENPWAGNTNAAHQPGILFGSACKWWHDESIWFC
jgi:hypothetical protein